MKICGPSTCAVLGTIIFRLHTSAEECLSVPHFYSRAKGRILTAVKNRWLFLFENSFIYLLCSLTFPLVKHHPIL